MLGSPSPHANNKHLSRQHGVRPGALDPDVPARPQEKPTPRYQGLFIFMSVTLVLFMVALVLFVLPDLSRSPPSRVHMHLFNLAALSLMALLMSLAASLVEALLHLAFLRPAKVSVSYPFLWAICTCKSMAILGIILNAATLYFYLQLYNHVSSATFESAVLIVVFAWQLLGVFWGIRTLASSPRLPLLLVVLPGSILFFGLLALTLYLSLLIHPA